MKEYIHAKRSGNWNLILNVWKNDTIFPWKWLSLLLNLVTCTYKIWWIYHQTWHYRSIDNLQDMATLQNKINARIQKQTWFNTRKGSRHNVFSRWLSGTTATHDNCTSMEEFTGVLSATKEQYENFGSARKTQDAADLQKISEWFEKSWSISCKWRQFQ